MLRFSLMTSRGFLIAPTEFAGGSMNKQQALIIYYCLIAAVIFAGCGKKAGSPGAVKDEALMVGRTAETFPAADEDSSKTWTVP
jgi:hypothetical protein